MRPLTGLCVLAAVALPWYLLVGLRTDGDWLAGFLGTHNVGRFLKPMEGHRGPIVYYVAAIAAGFFPWSWFFLPSLLELVNRIRRHPAWASYLFVACWAGFYIGFFSLARTKLPSYVLPAYPALALMTGVFIDHWLTSPRQVSRWMVQTGLVGIALVGLAFTIAFPLAAPYVLPGQGALGLVGLTLVVGGLAGWALFRLERPHASAAAIALAAVAFATGLLGYASVRASRSQNSARLIALIREADPDPVEIAVFDYNAPSLVFYARQPLQQFYVEREVEQYFAQRDNAYLITRAECLDQLKGALPEDVTELARQPRFLRRGKELVVLGRPAKLARAKRPQPY
jgi:4-amino-4-deoxy-L-arabinose transferase-like glycosyltransferase